MANTLTGLIPTLYEAMDRVSRELVGFIPAVARNMNAERAAKDETVRIPLTPTVSASDVAPGVSAPDNGDQTVNYLDMTLSKSRYVPIRWNGEEQKIMGNAGTFDKVLADQFTQAMRTLCNEVETDLGALNFAASRAYGTAGTAPFASDLSDPAQVRKILSDNGAPLSDLQLVIDTTAGAKLRTLAQLTKANEMGSDQLLRRGTLLDLHGFAIRESAKVRLEDQAAAASYVTNGIQAVGATSIAVVTGVAAIGKGAIITFAADTANKYVVAADYAGGAGNIIINGPGLINSIATANAITVTTTSYRANLAFDRSAIQLVTRLPAMPLTGDMADDVVEVTDPESGLSFQVALYRQYRQIHYEVGLAWGCAAVKPAHIAIMLG